jgi:hypothetical protein
MKLTVFIALFFALAMSPLMAEPPEGGHERGGKRHHGQRTERNPGEHLTEALGLSEDQAAEIDAIFAAQRAEHEAIRESHQEQREAFMAERCARRADVEAQIANVLDDDQLTQFEDMKAKREAKMAKRAQKMQERRAKHIQKMQDKVDAGELTEEEAQERGMAEATGVHPGVTVNHSGSCRRL